MSEQEIDKIKDIICDNYCKFPDMYLSEYADPDEANTAMMNEECEYCPLGALKWTGQIDFFDLIEKQYEQDIKSCLTCENCRPTQMFKHFCNPTRQVITEHTGSWLCKNKLYERRIK